MLEEDLGRFIGKTPRDAVDTGETKKQPAAVVDIRTIKFSGGLGSPQKGEFMVCAATLDATGECIGGGWIESFMTKEEAKACMAIINNLDSRHEASVWPVEK